MAFRTLSGVVAALVVSACLNTPTRAELREGAGVVVRVQFLKRSSFEHESRGGPVLVGPQSGLELEWRLSNTSGGTLEVPAPDQALRLRVVKDGREIAVTTVWPAEMTLRTEIGDHLNVTTVPAVAFMLPESSGLWIRGSTRRVDGMVFAPGDYVLELDVTGMQRVLSAAPRPVPQVDPGFPIRLHIAALDSAARQRQFHIIEGGFYDDSEGERALAHYVALASMPDAPWQDSLPLAQLYGSLGRHREAVTVYRRIMLDLTRAPETPFGRELIQKSGHLRRAAMSFVVEGDIATARELLRREGLTPEEQIPSAIEQLRQRAPKAAAGTRK